MWWTKPAWLLALILLIPVLKLGGMIKKKTSETNLLPWKRLASDGNRSLLNRLTCLRAAAVIVIILALAGTKVFLPASGRSIVFLLDTSGSIGLVEQEKARRSLLTIIKGLPATDRVAVAVFAGRPRLVTDWTTPKEAAQDLQAATLEAPEPGESDLQAALGMGKELLELNYANRCIVLLTDGRSTRGGPVLPVPDQVAKIPVYIVPIGETAHGIIAKELELPDLVHPGNGVLARWKVNAEYSQVVEAIIKLDGRTVGRRQIQLTMGENQIDLELPAASVGAHLVQLEIRLPYGQLLSAAGTEGLFQVGDKSRILVVSGDSARPALLESLRIQGWAAEPKRIGDFPETVTGLIGYGAVILDNVAATWFTDEQRRVIQGYVAGGGGLLVIGGDASLGRGEYYETELEEILPVETDTRRRLFFSKIQLLFVIDRSGSMSEIVGKTSKQLAAMGGIAMVVKELNPQDEVGILAFADQPEWVVPFTPVSRRAEILEALAKLGEGGGTVLGNTLEEITKSFGTPGPVRRHVMIITDGITADSDFKKIIDRLAVLGVTVSTIGIGAEIDEATLQKIAAWGKGQFYQAQLDQMPQVIRKDTLRISRDLIQEGQFQPVPKSVSPLSTGLNPVLPVLGYLVTKPKQNATIHWEIGKHDPLLATWRYGAGQVAVFTSDSGLRWLTAWSGRSEYNQLWSKIIHRIARSSQDQGLKVKVFSEAATVKILVDAIGSDRRLRQGLRLVGYPDEQHSLPFDLKETSPGRYEATLPISETGLRSYLIRDSLSGEWAVGWAWHPPGEEFRLTGPDLPLLRRLSGLTGGQVLTENGLKLSPPAWNWQVISVESWLILLALVLLIVELGIRSTAFGQLTMFKAMAEVWLATQKRMVEIFQGNGFNKTTIFDRNRTLSAYRYLAENLQQKKRGDSQK